MLHVGVKSLSKGWAIALLLLAMSWVAPMPLHAGKKKNTAPAAPVENVPMPDFSKVVFPPPPAVTRLKYLDYFSAEKPDDPKAPPAQKKSGWMDRLAGTSPDTARTASGHRLRFQLLAPYGLAVDSKGLLYVADTKVGAVFIFNTENNDVAMIKAGVDAKFKSIFGLAIDDGDHLFVTDGAAHEVFEFDARHKLVDAFGTGILKEPCGVAIDNENRLLYVADVDLDQVVVFDADSHKMLRKIGTTGKNHTLTDQGDFSKPTFVAVNKEGDVYVTDTMNDRVEVFDADGSFIRAFGQNGDGVGDFARPKGIAIDADGHVWVADAMLNRLQVFTSDGQVLMSLGSFGIEPAQFQALTGLAYDAKNNRLFTAEQLYGRVQMFRYFTDTEAKAELEKRGAERKAEREAEREKKTSGAAAASSGSAVGGQADAK